MVWETFAAQFAGSAGKGLGQGLGSAIGGGGGPTSSGLDLQGAAWQVGGGDWSVPITVTAASPGAAVTADAAGRVPAWLILAGLLGALWLMRR